MCHQADARFVCEPAAVGQARAWVRGQLASLYDDLDSSIVDDVGLTVSELATNCVRADAHDLIVSVTAHRDDVVVAATDDAPGSPELEVAAHTATSGRGLQIVQAVTSEWGVERGTSADDHKTVWGRFALSGATSSFDCDR